MSVKARNGRLEYRFMFRGQRVFQAAGLADTGPNRKLVEDLEAAHRQKLREGALGIRKLDAQPFSRAYDAFLAHEKLARKDKPTTWKRIATSGASLKLYFGSKTVYLITAGDIEGYKTWRLSGDEECQIAAVKSVTVRHDLDNLSLFFQWARKNELARANPIDEIAKPLEGESERMYILSLDEERRYFSYLREHAISENGNLHDVGRLMIQQGLRPEEVMTLPKGNFDLEARTVRVGKSKTKKGTGRVLQLTTESWQILARRLSTPGPWLFPSSRRLGAHITKLNCPHDRALEKLKMNFVLYDFRHTFATRFIEAGGDVAVLKDIMGHKDLRTTMRYVHLSQAHQFEAMRKFEERRLAIEKQWDAHQAGNEMDRGSR